jgi:hypothetical protein
MKTVNLTPSWETALNICTLALERTHNDIRSARGRTELQARIDALRETFLPLCRTIDARNEEIRKEQEREQKPTVCPECADTLPCGHAEIDEEARCAICGGEGL